MIARRADSWSFEQTSCPRVKRLLEQLRHKHPDLVDFTVVDCEWWGVAQHRRRIIAGSPHLISRLLAARSARPSTINDVFPAPPTQLVMNHTTNTPISKAQRTAGGATYRPLRPEEHTRSVHEAAYCVMAGAAQTWVDADYQKVATMTVAEAAALQSFDKNHKLSATKARIGVGNAVPPEVAYRLLHGPREWRERARARIR